MTVAPPASYPDALAPLRLPEDLRLSPEQFGAVCTANPQAVLELTPEGHLINMTPTGGETGARNSRLLMRLLAWADSVGGWQVFDSSTGFLLPVAARLLRRSWLGAQPRCLLGAPRALAGPHHGAAPWVPAPLPRSAGRIRQAPWPQRVRGATALDDGERFPGLRLELAEIWEA